MSWISKSVHYQINGRNLIANLDKGVDISIPLSFEDANPNCYWANPPQAQVIRSGDFVGSVKAGGTVNYHELTFTPHGNGTHTETIAHISAEGILVHQALADTHFHAQLVTCQLSKSGGDFLVDKDTVLDQLASDQIPEALIIRTMPNNTDKRTRQYSGTNPAYLDPRLGKELHDLGIAHLLVDLPSLDREEDEGRLSVHRGFFGRKPNAPKTVTELIYVPDILVDGFYLLQLQIPAFLHDAAPSRPILYPLETKA